MNYVKRLSFFFPKGIYREIKKNKMLVKHYTHVATRFQKNYFKRPSHKTIDLGVIGKGIIDPET